MDEKRGEVFHVRMGTCDDAKISELAGLFILYKFQQLNKISSFGLYIEDGLAVVKNMSGSQSGKVKEELQVLFKEFGHFEGKQQYRLQKKYFLVQSSV